jgi:phosphate transport system protein
VNTTHFEDSLQRDIDRLCERLSRMAQLTEHALRQSIKALMEKNRELAYAVILRDQYIDECEKEIDRLCLEFLVRQQPVATPLRFAYSAIKINLELERIGDYAESIARQALKLSAVKGPLPFDRFREMADLSIPMVRDAVNAFIKQDGDLARKTIATEQTVDVLKSRLNQDLIRMFRENVFPLEALNPLITLARRLERVSDQARNICMETLYTCTGDYAKHPGTDIMRLLFVDEHNSCRSQMAEAIANSLRQGRFVFGSAGLDPQPVDPRTIAFMKSKGFDISRMTPKQLAQVPNLDHYKVVVALAKEAEQAFPKRPQKVIMVDWTIEDPSKTQGTAAEVQAAYERTFQYIQDHIKDLIAAIEENNQPS